MDKDLHSPFNVPALVTEPAFVTCCCPVEGMCKKALSYFAASGTTHFTELEKIHHQVHRNPPLVPILSQMNPIHSLLSYFLKIFPYHSPTYRLQVRLHLKRQQGHMQHFYGMHTISALFCRKWHVFHNSIFFLPLVLTVSIKSVLNCKCQAPLGKG
jgi:hypothetical protein